MSNQNELQKYRDDVLWSVIEYVRENGPDTFYHSAPDDVFAVASDLLWWNRKLVDMLNDATDWRYNAFIPIVGQAYMIDDPFPHKDDFHTKSYRVTVEEIRGYSVRIKASPEGLERRVWPDGYGDFVSVWQLREIENHEQ